MIVFWAITSSIIFITLLYINKIKSKKTLIPPGPPGLPLIGNIHQLATASNLHVYLWKLSKKYGPLMYMRQGPKPMLIISSAKLAEEVLKTQESSFCSRPKFLGLQKLSYNFLDVAFAPYGSYWREVRKITVFHLLSVKKVQSYRPIREEEISRMVKSVSESASAREVVNLSEMAMDVVSMLICRITFGKRYEKQESQSRRFYELLQEAQAVMAAFFLSDYYPSLGWVDKLSGLMDKLEVTFKKLDTFYQELIDEHLDPKWEKTMSEQGNILDVLIQLRAQQSCSIDLNWDSIKALLMNMFIGGTDTSAATLVWTMTALVKAPTVMKKLQTEIRDMILQKPQVDEDDLQQLPYLKAVISEVFRLYPPVPLLVPRETTDKCILEGYQVEPKTVVYINAWAIGRDPEYWENHDKFQPERFLANDIKVKGHDFGVIPFGSGRRICPGMSMGLVTLELMVANLLYFFDWEFPPGVSAETIDEDALPGITIHKKNPLALVPKSFIR